MPASGVPNEPNPGGRRSYDETVPTVAYVEERLLRVFEEQLKDTRHALRDDISVLATSVQSASLKSAQDYGNVQTQLAKITGVLAEVPPLKAAVTELEKADTIEAAASKMRRTIWRAAAVLAGLLVSVAGVLVAASH